MVKTSDFIFKAGNGLSLFNPSFSENYSSKKETTPLFDEQIKTLRKLQSMLYAQARHGVLIILQAMDAGGKDGVIKHVMSGVNPQGCQVKSFKAPSSKELAHDFMWRCFKAMPERGNIGIFNRSYYEEVLIAKIHPRLLANQNLPFYHSKLHKDQQFWNTRYQDIVNIEKYFVHNGYTVLKFFLNISHEEQKRRFLSRIENPEKNWKFMMSDVIERQHWHEYQSAYKEMLENTSHEPAPWYVIPADKKWYMRLVISKIIVEKLNKLDLSYPQVNDKHIEDMSKAKEMLNNE